MKVKFKVLSILIIAVIVFGGVFGYRYFKFYNAVSAAGGFPYQVGLVNTFITPCIITPVYGLCVGAGDPTATLACNTKGPAVCTTFSYVSGVPAGGMGVGALLSDVVIAKIGLVPGASYIGGGMSPVLMETGVSASIGGAYPGVAKMIKKILGDGDYMIAGGK